MDPAKITVAYLAADKFDGAPEPMPAYTGKQFIMYVGRAEPYKNNRRLMQAHQQLLANNSELRLLIVGRQDAQRLADMQWASEQGFKNIDFLGFVSDAQLAWLYANCRAYVFPSLMEGFGLPSLEAMTYGAPVASSFATCLPEINGDAAVYFDPENLADMVQVIGNLINDERLRADLKAKGFRQVKKYSWRTMAEQTLAMYNQALQQKTD